MFDKHFTEACTNFTDSASVGDIRAMPRGSFAHLPLLFGIVAATHNLNFCHVVL